MTHSEVSPPAIPSAAMWAAAQTAIQAQHRARWWPGINGTFTNHTIVLDEAARKGLILRRIDRWREAVQLQHERVTKSGDRHIVDIHFYVIAVDNLADAVKVIHAQYPQLMELRAPVQDALDQYSAAAPDIHDLRNVIEHFEEYDHMVGRLQTGRHLPKGTPLLPVQRLGQVENYSLLDGDAQLAIFGKYMRVSATTPAAIQLAADVLALKDQIPG